MQNQKSTPKRDLDFPTLTPEEWALVEAYRFDGLNQSESYKKAYNAVNYGRNALAVQASRKFAEEHIQEAIRILNSQVIANTDLNLERRIACEMAFAKRAEDAGNFGAAGGAYDRINKLCGLYVERHEDVSTADPSEVLRLLAQESPEIAELLANQHNISVKEH